ncbi:iron chelate uptake ABC transporter family permease subunit [Staphylococcus massiliensis]|uniref:Cobalamin Fe3+-siderophores ABC transporter permease n=1 Tax=Staphylococcus massiliensis S46 TaxID=1229783 RepID=K9AR64_9STAP|nr:iron chelate uptake ABC transporter family permease subunit [Staphylococcus massiliensis]EKU48531.1 cobalamin Fe3+-siderophores ABC transporter permease [Staphylococcus massiliensis S46]MCG3412679.1 iron chelate uptake ABC transporter family permease subunit [Staphylococcus massiliensis]POA01540.1 iron ABC transporter permease [Staphylococcus massiliensis CCUG 55927]
MKLLEKKKKLILLVAVTLIISIAYLFIGLDFEIFEYQFSSRVRKLVLMLFVGAAIATSVTIFQAITVNRLLTPSIMGLDAVYIFIKVLLIFVFGVQSFWNTNIYANFIITVFVMMLFALILFQVIFKTFQFSVYMILLMGVVMGTFFKSITGFIELLINPEDFLQIQSAMFASFDASNSKLVLLSAIILIMIILSIVRLLPTLDVLLLGKAHAINLGIRYEVFTRLLMILVAILVSISTALVGPITFLGLMTINIAHEFMKTYEHKYLLPVTICLSWIVLILAQFGVEQLFEATNEVSILINLVGGSYFIYILVKRRHLA